MIEINQQALRCPPQMGAQSAAKFASAPKRVLIKEANWLGDVVMSLPALRALRRTFPASRLSVLIKRELASFFDGSSWIDEVIPYKLSPGLRGLLERPSIVREIRARHFDLAVLFPNSFEAAFWAALGRVTHRAGFARNGRSFLLTHRARLTPEVLANHQVHYYLDMVRQTLGVEGDAADCAPDIHEPHRLKMHAWLAERRRRPSGRLIALAPAAAYGPAKEWPLDRYATLVDLIADRYGAECVLMGAPAERAKCERVAANARHGAIVAAGEANIGEVIAMLSIADGFAGNDSGGMHVAGAIGIPTVGIFGSTSPARTAPLGPRTRAIYHQIECSPCLARTCKFGHYKCLTRISADEVAHALEELGAVG